MCSQYYSGISAYFKQPVLLLSFLVLYACSDESTTEPQEKISGRWYSEQQVEQGEKLYREHCIACHGVNARGSVREWQKPLADGSYPPPPLNGTAHT